MRRTMNTANPKSEIRNPRFQRAWPVLETILVLAVFALSAGWPPPDPNEAHYLAKAKHYWEPTWLAGDFFLESADTHLTFYVALGWLTKFLSLPATAWCGRIITWALLAAAWRRLSVLIVPRAGWAVFTAALFVTLSERCHMAGEWVVGGFEAKGLAYALVWFALGDVVSGRWIRAWLLMGAASALHVVVGGWSVVAAGLAWLSLGQERPKLASMWQGLVGGGLLSLAGILPGLDVSPGVTPDVADAANRLYVYTRLTHHLLAQRFPVLFLERFSMLFCVWLALCAFTPCDAPQRRLRRFVAGALVVSAAGAVIGLFAESHPATVASVLRFYWFRLADSMLSLGVALVGTAFITARLTSAPRRSAWQWAALGVALVLTGWHLGASTLQRMRPAAPRADAPNKVLDYADWRAACEWIAANTPASARFLTPRSSQTFKWYAGRSEVVTWKDMPQGAGELVAWWQRMQDVHGTGDPADPFYDTLAELSVDRLRRTAEKYGASYLLTSREPSLPLPRLYENDSYAVYAFATAP